MVEDPTASTRQLLRDVFAEEEVDPIIAMTAMLQLAAKISYDFGKQEGLDDALNGERWLGGCMMAFDAAAEGKLFGNAPAAKERLKLIQGGLDQKTYNKRRRRRKLSRKSRKKNR